ncbi:two-component sensor histidine kinase [Pseudoalteromonas sp. J010]|uniref:sensor histidine kinase n=1 Tax=Pseudoalteromonas sp. J010 TaxID=998465 RepID=UPI000F653138|nr:ATP-binding protein [Pseudoalteromonas sp. J010]RRS06856.1 two-component sensor histidine kinase [Pseudoalteromonas sp. J010]
MKPISLAKKIYLHFFIIGSSVFSLIGISLYLFSTNYANLAVKESMFGMSEDIQEQLSFNSNRELVYQSDNVAEKWGYDALYNNLVFRVTHGETNETLLQSTSNITSSAALQALIDNQDIPVGYSHLKGIDRYRIETEIDNVPVNIYLGRNDLLGELANEAVMPALSQVSIFIIIAAFFVFMLVGYLSIRSIVKPVKSVAAQLARVRPEQLNFRLSEQGLPVEIVPIVHSLNQAIARVETGFDEQKRFVANAAHELKTPLAILNTRVELAKLDKNTHAGILADVSYMTRVVQQLLDLSRAQSLDAYAKQSLSITPLAKEACMMLAPLSVTLNKQLELEIDENGEMFAGDQSSIHIMIKNLIENALRHSAEGALIKVHASGNSISVMDSGPGIDIQNYEKIFERFWRKEQSSMTGSGLGLAIVKEVVDLHHATLDVTCKNTLGGATFSVTFSTLNS